MTKRIGKDRIRVSEVKLDRVVRKVAKETRVSASLIRPGINQKPSVRGRPGSDRAVAARWKVWAELARPGVSVASIARIWPCDHTTIRHALIKQGLPTCA